MGLNTMHDLPAKQKGNNTSTTVKTRHLQLIILLHCYHDHGMSTQKLDHNCHGATMNSRACIYHIKCQQIQPYPVWSYSRYGNKNCLCFQPQSDGDNRKIHIHPLYSRQSSILEEATTRKTSACTIITIILCKRLLLLKFSTI